jgi:hypothetical protein
MIREFIRLWRKLSRLKAYIWKPMKRCARLRRTPGEVCRNLGCLGSELDMGAIRIYPVFPINTCENVS